MMCKPKDDLRKDSRLMEFNALVNKVSISNMPCTFICPAMYFSISTKTQIVGIEDCTFEHM